MGPSKHAQFSPSSSPYWYNDGNGCPGRVMWYDDRTFSYDPGAAALEGSRLHEVAEGCIQDPDTVLTGKDFEAVGDYVEYIRARMQTHEVLIEQEVDLEWITGEKDAVGSVDALVLPKNDDQVPEVVDLKTGAVRVEPTTSQLRMYAAGAMGKKRLKRMGDREVKLTIHQGGQAVSVCYAAADLLAFAKSVKKYVKRAQKRYEDTGELEFNPGDKNCTWCMHLQTCPKLQGFKDEQAANVFAVHDSGDLIASDLAMVGAMRKWCDATEKKALELATSGVQLEGFKLVRARTNRKWNAQAEEKLVALLGDAAYSKKLIGLAAAEKLVDDTTMAECVEKPEGKPTLAPLTDKRPAIDDATTDFKDA